jgi:hypothetical protein
MRRVFLFLSLSLLFLAPDDRAQDVLTLGGGSASSGGTVLIPVSILDHTGTPLGSDAGTGNRIQGIAFKILFPTELVQSISFARSGVTSSLTPLFEATPSGDGFLSYIASFAETTNAIPFTPNGSGAGDEIGTLTVTLKSAATVGTSITLRLDPPSAFLSNQASTVNETIALGNLSVVNGSVSVTLDAPTGLVATASSETQVNLSWTAAPGADHYEVWRFNGGSFGLIASPSGTTHSDTTVTSGNTYLYKVLAVDGSGGDSPFSNIDPATTIVFTDDPLAPSTLIKATHILQLRVAVNAFRSTAGLPALPGDSTIASGQPVRATHIADLRTALNQPRTAAGLTSLTFTDPALTAGVTLIKSVDVTELRNGVK